MAFLRAILLIIAIYYLLKLFIQYVVPFLLLNYVDRKMNTTNRQPGSGKKMSKREGEVTIDYLSKQPAKKVNDKGEYVDYEEIKD